MFEFPDYYLQDLLLDLPTDTLLVLTFRGFEGQRALKRLGEGRMDQMEEFGWSLGVPLTPFHPWIWEGTRIVDNQRESITAGQQFVRSVYPHLKRLVIVPPDGDPFVYSMGYGRHHYHTIDPKVFLNRAKVNKNLRLLWLHVKATVRNWLIDWCLRTSKRLITSMDRYA